MKLELNYEYASPSACIQEGDKILLGLSPDLSRKEKISFKGRLKHPLLFRDAMLVLREIVISDLRMKKKDYSDFFNWLNEELDDRMNDHQKFAKVYKKELENKMSTLKADKAEIVDRINNDSKSASILKHEIDKFDIWYEYDKLERKFWDYIKTRDTALASALWWVLDPVITVHPDQVSFEAFSLDESIYGCLSINKEGFEIIGTPQLGTTNIDFSAKLANEIERFRTYNDVELSINPEGFKVDTGVTPEHVEKKIDLPESWIKGFNQVSAAASLQGIDIEISSVDMYDICSFLRRNRARKSPRSMKWILEPQERIKIIFKPWNKELILSVKYQGKKKRVERIWGRRRWLILERIIPIAKSFKIKFFGFGMPQFIIANLGSLFLTIGFTSWSANDWVKGTAFNIMAGFIGNGTDEVYRLLKSNRIMTFEEIKTQLNHINEKNIQAGIGKVLRKGEAYYDSIINSLRFRQLLNVPLPKDLYEITSLERDVLNLINSPKNNISLVFNENSEIVIENFYNVQVRRRIRQRRYDIYDRSPEYRVETKTEKTIITLDQDGQIIDIKCGCKEFKQGPQNLSAPCSHVLSLYATTSKFINLPFKIGKKYNYNQLEEMIASD